MGERDRGFAAEEEKLVWEIEAKVVWVQAEEHSRTESMNIGIEKGGSKRKKSREPRHKGLLTGSMVWLWLNHITDHSNPSLNLTFRRFWNTQGHFTIYRPSSCARHCFKRVITTRY